MLVQKLEQECKEKFGKDYIYVDEVTKLEVVEVDTPFTVDGYDGMEYIVEPQDITWFYEDEICT